MDETLELEKFEKEFTSIYDVVMSSDLDIEECRKLSNKLVLLSKNMDDLFGELTIKCQKKEKKNFIVSTIQSLISLLCLIMCNTSLIFSAIAVANLVITLKNVKKNVQERESYIEISKQGKKMVPLINNCSTFLNKKIKLACNITKVDQNNEQSVEINEQYVNLMTVNNIIYSCIYNGLPFNPVDEEQKEMAIRILQSDLGTEESDISKLINMAREKVQKESNFTRTLHKN